MASDMTAMAAPPSVLVFKGLFAVAASSKLNALQSQKYRIVAPKWVKQTQQSRATVDKHLRVAAARDSKSALFELGPLLHFLGRQTWENHLPGGACFQRIPTINMRCNNNEDYAHHAVCGCSGSAFVPNSKGHVVFRSQKTPTWYSQNALQQQQQQQ